MAVLARVSAVLLGLLVVHVLDHTFRQDRTTPSELGVVGTLGLVAVIVVLAAALMRRREAPALAVLVGGATAVGFVVVHLLPRWSLLSDPYPELHLDALSWASMLASLLAGAALAAAGVRQRGRVRAAR